MCLIWLLILNGHLYLSGMSFGVAPKRISKWHVFKRDRTASSYMKIILGSIVQFFEEIRYGLYLDL